MSAFSRPARLQNDPDKYIRFVAKGGKYQARPYDLGHRYNLGLFPTKHAARKAIERFWWGDYKPRLKFARPVRMRADGPVTWIAVVRVPAERDRRRLRGRDWRDERRRLLLAGVGPDGPDPTRPKLVSVRVPGVFASDVGAHEAAVAWLVREVGLLVAFHMAGPDSPVFNPPRAAQRAAAPLPPSPPSSPLPPPPPAPRATFGV